MTQRVEDKSNQTVVISNVTPIVIQGDPAGVPIPVSGAGGFSPQKLADCQVLKTGINVNSSGTFATKFLIRNNCVEGINLPMLVGFCNHALTGDFLKMRLILYATEARYLAMNTWGYADMAANADTGPRFSVIEPSVPALPLSNAAESRLEAIGWEIAAVQLAWATGGSSYNVEVGIIANFDIVEYTP